MPKRTFFNLPMEKQETIIAAAKKEFSMHSYHDASINRIIKDAKIPRGSFYMYFENKEDVFYYILESFQSIIQKQVLQKLVKLDTKGNNLVDIYLEIFDLLITTPVLLENKDFFMGIFVHMNISVTKELLSFRDEHIQKKQGMIIKFWEKIELFDNKTSEEIIHIIDVFRLLVVDAVISVLSEEKSSDDVKTALRIKIQFFERGIKTR